MKELGVKRYVYSADLGATCKEGVTMSVRQQYFNGVFGLLLGCLLVTLVQGKWQRFLLDKDPISCDFESGFCSYLQQHNDNYDWSIGSGRTRSSNTGPYSDHGLDSDGHYAYIDSSEHNPGKTARIISPVFPNPTLDHYKVQFWYDMEGDDIGELNVFVRSHGNALRNPVLSLSGDQDKGWHQVCLDIPHGYDRFQVAFEGISYGNRGDIAIDDVLLSHGSCNLSTRNISCDFDHDSCGYDFWTDNNYHWVRRQFGTPTSKTGPVKDHTSGTGFYVYSEANSGLEGDVAGLVSPSFETDEHHLSVQFWYNMNGIDMGELDVFYIVGEWQSDSLFYRGRPAGQNWHSACINLPLYTHNIRLVFEAVRGFGSRSDIAIDDIKLQPGFCKESHVLSPAPIAKTTANPRTTAKTATTPSAHWSRWSAYGACSVTCGSSVVRASYRLCVGGNTCPGSASRTKPCALPDCPAGPVNGHWSTWSTWTSCSKSCDLGQISRTRSCDNPVPSSGGKSCPGNKLESKDCSLGPCPSWSHWFEGSCSNSCGNGTMERLRTCSSGHVEDCPGSSYELVPCSGVICIQ